MLPLKLVRSLIFGETTINNPFLVTQSHHRDHDPDGDDYDSDGTGNESTHHRDKPRTRRRRRRAKSSKKTPFLLFVPTKELVADTYRLATIARDMGMDLYPTPSLSHIIFSYPSSAPSPSSTSSAATSSFPSSWSSVSLLPNDAVPLPFPSLTTASSSLCHLRSFAALSRGLFKLVFIDSSYLATTPKEQSFNSVGNWDCGSFSLLSRLTGDRIQSMDGFIRALAGVGWSLFKTTKNPSPDPGDAPVPGRNPIYLFRKVDSRRVRVMRTDGDGGAVTGECRIRELRLPPLDFRNAPLRILQYIILMTDDIFYLA